MVNISYFSQPIKFWKWKSEWVEISHSTAMYLRLHCYYFQIDYKQIWNRTYLFPLPLEFLGICIHNLSNLCNVFKQHGGKKSQLLKGWLVAVRNYFASICCQIAVWISPVCWDRKFINLSLVSWTLPEWRGITFVIPPISFFCSSTSVFFYKIVTEWIRKILLWNTPYFSCPLRLREKHSSCWVISVLGLASKPKVLSKAFSSYIRILTLLLVLASLLWDLSSQTLQSFSVMNITLVRKKEGHDNHQSNCPFGGRRWKMT